MYQKEYKIYEVGSNIIVSNDYQKILDYARRRDIQKITYKSSTSKPETWRSFAVVL